ncbi:hypothetical protein RB195_012366 [Necator americanus]|uniref:Uncharacterized protein n=1 Tax=Necator americanus TaxID=51031 RepID=A0ABR1D7Y2_NECAM
MSLAVRLLYLLVLVNIAACHYYWFEMPEAQKFNDGSDIPYDDEPLQMQKRFHVKYIRKLGRLPGDHYHLPVMRGWSTPMSPQDHLVDLYNALREVV